MKLSLPVALSLALLACGNSATQVPVTIQPTCSCPGAGGTTVSIVPAPYNICVTADAICFCTATDAGGCCDGLADAGCTGPETLSCVFTAGPDGMCQ